jgi:hypothetical protein
MTRTAAHKLARLLRAQGYAVTVIRHAPMRGCVFYTVKRSDRPVVPASCNVCAATIPVIVGLCQCYLSRLDF